MSPARASLQRIIERKRVSVRDHVMTLPHTNDRPKLQKEQKNRLAYGHFCLRGALGKH